jgi:predicted choloylglycine hydrolase
MKNFLKKYCSKNHHLFQVVKKDLMFSRFNYDKHGFSRFSQHNLQIVFPLYGSKLSFFKTQGQFVKQKNQYGLNQTITVQC